jgi:multidrug efflux pump subunit AcrB
LIIAISVAGIFAFFRLGRAEDPSFVVKVMTIAASWPGATAQEMQEQVADRLEKRLQELEAYDRVETAARPGLVTMKLYLKDDTDAKTVEEQFYQVRKKLGDEAANLPRRLWSLHQRRILGRLFLALLAGGQEAAASPAGPAGRGYPPAPAARAGVQKVNILGEQQQRISSTSPTSAWPRWASRHRPSSMPWASRTT